MSRLYSKKTCKIEGFILNLGLKILSHKKSDVWRTEGPPHIGDSAQQEKHNGLSRFSGNA